MIITESNSAIHQNNQLRKEIAEKEEFIMNELQDKFHFDEIENKFYFDGKLVAKVFKDLDGEYGIWYSNDQPLYLGAVKLLADWEISIYEKLKSIQ